MRLHWGKDSRPFHECILLKCRRVRIHEKGMARRLTGNEETRFFPLCASILRKLEYFKDAARQLLIKDSIRNVTDIKRCKDEANKK